MNTSQIALFILTTFAMPTSRAMCQGGVDIKYIPIDSANSTLLNQAVKIDFRSRKDEQHSRYFPDTISLKLNDKVVEFTERKGRGTDYYYFDKECLESKTLRPGQIARIYNCVVKDIRPDSILFFWTIQFYKKGKKKASEEYGNDHVNILVFEKGEEVYLEQSESMTSYIWISTKVIAGLLIKL